MADAEKAPLVATSTSAKADVRVAAMARHAPPLPPRRSQWLQLAGGCTAAACTSLLQWLICWYRESCGFCKLLEPEYERAAADLKHIVHFAAIDVERQPQLAGKVQKKYGFSVDGVPTVKLVAPGSSVAQDYRGERTAKAIKAAAYQAMPAFVELVSPAGLQRSLEKHGPKARRAILFSAKGVVPPLFKAVSSAYRGRIEFAQVAVADLGREPGKALADRYGIETLPTLVVLRREADAFEDAKWLEDKFGSREFASLSWGAGEKPSFRKIEGWLMGYSRAPRTSPAPRRRQKSKGEL